MPTVLVALLLAAAGWSLLPHDALLELGDAVPLGAVPTTVVVDREGRVAARIVGIASYYTLKGLVDERAREGS